MLHGGDIYGASEKLGVTQKEIIDFSANISPLGLPKSVKEAVISELDNALHYPDTENRRLRTAVSKAFSKKGFELTPDMLICGNGAADIVYRFVYAAKPKKALVIHPTFVEYEEALRCVGTEIEGYELNHDNFEIGMDILEKIRPGISAVFICNPNNPTGVITDKELLFDVIKKAGKAGAFVVLDECFLDFSENENQLTMAGVLEDAPHLVILRSFTKMYAMPGLRLGFAMTSNRALIEKMKKCGQSWPVSTTAESAGIAALLAEEYHREVIEYVSRERAWIEKELSSLGIFYIRSHANYILIRVPHVKDLYGQLLKEHIIIRRCENYVNLDGSYYRIAVNGHDKNVCLIESLKKILEESGTCFSGGVNTETGGKQ